MKRLGKIGLALAGLFLAAVVVLYLSLNTIIQRGIEAVGPKITGTAVTLKSVSLSPLSGRGRIKGLIIGNPQGFKTENAIRLEETRLRLEAGSVFSDKIVINEIFIDGPEVTFERGPGGSNIARIQKNVEAFTSGGPGRAKPAAQRSEADEKKFIIDRLVVKNGRVRLSAAVMEGRAVEVALPDIHLQGIGRKSGGATLEEVSDQVFAAIISAINRAVSDAGLRLGREKAEETLKDIGGAAGEGIKRFFGK